jgi:predicted metal-dependent HD superfamily phosphohydrolase
MNDCTFDRLNHRWRQFYCDSISFELEVRDRVFDRLVCAYTQPERYYHNLDHLDCVLTTLDRFTDIHNPRAVYLAAWWHDFVYDPHAGDNEAKSAELARDFAIDLGESSETIDRLQQLILATQGHQIDPHDLDLCIFLDADLAILGAQPARYRVYQQAIRQEYSWVAATAYQSGRIRVLESFLQRDRLYFTDLLFGELESLARSNLQREIAFLKS